MKRLASLLVVCASLIACSKADTAKPADTVAKPVEAIAAPSVPAPAAPPAAPAPNPVTPSAPAPAPTVTAADATRVPAQEELEAFLDNKLVGISSDGKKLVMLVSHTIQTPDGFGTGYALSFTNDAAHPMTKLEDKTTRDFMGEPDPAKKKKLATKFWAKHGEALTKELTGYRFVTGVALPEGKSSMELPGLDKAVLSTRKDGEDTVIEIESANGGKTSAKLPHGHSLAAAFVFADHGRVALRVEIYGEEGGATELVVLDRN